MWGFLRRLFSRAAAVDPLAGIDPATARLVVGLGNPGPEYADTRHNVGFRCVESIARRAGARWLDRADLHATVAVVRDDGGPTLVLAKPHTFMNRSGTAVRALLDITTHEAINCLIIYDDMDLPFGTLRLRERGSPGTHNGMRSVVNSLQTENIPRLRMGISQSMPGGATSHVLSEFSADEQEVAQALIERAADAACVWANEGPAVAMNRYNKA